MCFDLKTCVCTRTCELDSRLDWSENSDVYKWMKIEVKNWMKIRIFINWMKNWMKNMMFING